MHRLAFPLVSLAFASACSSAPTGDSQQKPANDRDDHGVVDGEPREATVAEPAPGLAGAPSPDTAAGPALPAAATVDATPAEARTVEPETVPVFDVTPIDVRVTWRSVQSTSKPATFVNVEAGVLAQVGDDYLALADTGEWIRTGYTAPDDGAVVMGVYPDNLWYVRVVSKGPLPNDRSGTDVRELSWMRLRGGTRWVPQEYLGQQRFEDMGHEARVGHRGGLVVKGDGSVFRVAGGDDEPVGGRCTGSLVDFVETRSGKLYTVCSNEHGVFAQTECEDDACSSERAVRLPHGRDWTFALQVARQRHSATLAGVVREGEQERPHLLHFETGGWKLEPMPNTVRGLWATKDGGLWTLAGDGLLHRDPAGGWRRVALPAGLTNISVAVTTDLRELYVAGEVAGEGRVFVTNALAQSPEVQPSEGDETN